MIIVSNPSFCIYVWYKKAACFLLSPSSSRRKYPPPPNKTLFQILQLDSQLLLSRENRAWNSKPVLSKGRLCASQCIIFSQQFQFSAHLEFCSIGSNVRKAILSCFRAECEQKVKQKQDVVLNSLGQAASFCGDV